MVAAKSCGVGSSNKARSSRGGKHSNDYDVKWHNSIALVAWQWNVVRRHSARAVSPSLILAIWESYGRPASSIEL